MTIACERRGLLRRVACLVCNQQEAAKLFSRNIGAASPEEVRCALPQEVERLGLASMVVTMSARGSVFAQMDGESGWCPAREVKVVDTTGAGDAFFAGVAIGLTKGKSLAESCEIGTELAASAISVEDNVCERLGLLL